MTLRLLLLSAAAAAGLAGGLRAENPRVTLQLRGVTADEAVGRLAEEARIPVRVYTAELPHGAPRNPREAQLQERSDFDWSGVTFARALRQVCEKYHLRPSRGAGGYTLYSSPGAPAFEPRVGLTEKDGVRLSVRSVSIYENRQVHFQNNAGASGGGSLQVYINADLAELDADTLAGVRNAVARDDLGNVLGQQGGGYYNGGNDSGFPDEWGTGIPLPTPHPRARKLVSLEGDLMVYRKVRPIRVEIPLPLAGKSVRKEHAGLAFWVAEFRPKPDDPDEDPEPLLNRAAVAGGGLTLRTRVYSPAAGGIQSRWGWGMVPYLVGASGRAYPPNQLAGNSGSDGEVMVNQSTLTFPNLNEPPASLVWDLLERGEAVKLFSFRMTDIPLPAPLEFNAKAAAPAPPEAGPRENRPFYRKDGGVLVHRITVGARAAGDGLLDVGLSPKAGTGWGPVRWIQIEVSGGEARLADLTPGTYKVSRRFRPRDEAFPKGGKWVGGEAQVTITAGKESPLPVLQWKPA